MNRLHGVPFPQKVMHHKAARSINCRPYICPARKDVIKLLRNGTFKIFMYLQKTPINQCFFSYTIHL